MIQPYKFASLFQEVQFSTTATQDPGTKFKSKASGSRTREWYQMFKLTGFAKLLKSIPQSNASPVTNGILRLPSKIEDNNK